MSTDRASSTAQHDPVPALCARGITLTLGGQTVLKDIDLQLSRGWTAVVGPNGAGKSSLLRVLAGLQKPDAGTVWLDGEALWAAGRPALSPSTRARRIAWLPQSAEAGGDLTLRETVALGRLPHRGVTGAWQPEDDRAIDAALQMASCTEWAHRPLASLSGGERQRGLLARALATGADVLLLDEPTTHLDPPHQVALARLARRLSHSHSVVSVVHDLPLALVADRIVVMAQGRVAAQGDSHDTALHRAVEACFGDAVRIVTLQDGSLTVQPRW